MIEVARYNFQRKPGKGKQPNCRLCGEHINHGADIVIMGPFYSNLHGMMHTKCAEELFNALGEAIHE